MCVYKILVKYKETSIPRRNGTFTKWELSTHIFCLPHTNSSGYPGRRSDLRSVLCISRVASRPSCRKVNHSWFIIAKLGLTEGKRTRVSAPLPYLASSMESWLSSWMEIPSKYQARNFREIMRCLGMWKSVTVSITWFFGTTRLITLKSFLSPWPTKTTPQLTR